jgi:BCD family chlorophyll transporter-like MFS transporter
MSRPTSNAPDPHRTTSTPLGWIGIVRLGLVQTALGAIVVLTTSAINRVMVVELALPALIPGLLVALHHAVQMLRPRWGYGSDIGGRLTPWIIGGMAILGLGGFAAAVAVSWMTANLAAGIALAIIAFTLVGVGTGAAGTCLLVLLAKRVAPERRGPAATVVWLMMIAGFAVTSGVVGHWLDPFSPERLVFVSGLVAALAVTVTVFAVWGLEGRIAPAVHGQAVHAKPPFREALAEVLADPDARRLTIFVFISMLGYFSEELVLDPFAGIVFGFTPGQSTKLSSTLHSGVFVGMISLAFAAGVPALRQKIPLAACMMWGCLASAAALVGLSVCALVGPPMPLKGFVFALGVANGIFSIAAIAWMMTLAGRGKANTEGVRMGTWGAAQGIAAGLGGVMGAGVSDLSRALIASPGTAYAVVLLLQAALFVCAARVTPSEQTTPHPDTARTARLVAAE